jgi:hypothetical protein
MQQSECILSQRRHEAHFPIAERNKNAQNQEEKPILLFDIPERMCYNLVYYSCVLEQ